LVVGRPGEAYNIGVETPEISMAELADKVVALGKELTGYTGKVVKKPDAVYTLDNPERRCPIIKKAREHLGYDPQVLVDEGLRRAMIWYSGNREAEES
jgi:nucleoside-diphosphate-sugar epimerase